MPAGELTPIGSWTHDSQGQAAFSPAELLAVVPRVREHAHVVRDGARGRLGVGLGGAPRLQAPAGSASYELLATLPPLYPEWLGDRTFLETHRVRFPYVTRQGKR